MNGGGTKGNWRVEGRITAGRTNKACLLFTVDDDEPIVPPHAYPRRNTKGIIAGMVPLLFFAVATWCQFSFDGRSLTKTI